jgi:hypothetical protein
VNHSTDAPVPSFPEPGTGELNAMKIGWELFQRRTDGGDLVTFVCYEDGYGVRLGGEAIPGYRWDLDGVDVALDAFRALAGQAACRQAISPPAA